MIGATLKKMRNIYGLKASEMSEKLGISNSYLSEIENEKKQPSLELLGKYSKVFDVKLSSLILLSEQYEEAKNLNTGQEFVKSLMSKLIDLMSNDSSGKQYEKV